MLALGLALLVFASAAAGDVAEIYQTRSIAAERPNPHRIARTSIVQWAIGCVGWIVVVEVSLWYLLPEVLGLYLGSYAGAWLAACRDAGADGAARALHSAHRVPDCNGNGISPGSRHPAQPPPNGDGRARRRVHHARRGIRVPESRRFDPVRVSPDL